MASNVFVGIVCLLVVAVVTANSPPRENNQQGGGAARGFGMNQGGMNQGGMSQGGKSQGMARSAQGGADGEEGQGPSAYKFQIYTDPEYYGYESNFPGGKAMFKSYRNADRGAGRSASEDGQDGQGGQSGQRGAKSAGQNMRSSGNQQQQN